MISAMIRSCCSALLALVLLIAAATVAPACCPGDCNEDGQVTIDELIGLISLQLNDLPGICGCLTVCTDPDPGSCANIDIVVLQSQFNLFNGCPSSLL